MKKLVSLALALVMLLSLTSAMADTVGGMADGWWKDIEIAPSETFHLDEPLTITALGIHFNQYPTEFDGCYYLPTVEKYTNVHLQVDWRPDSDWNTQVATALAGGIDNLPYLIRPGTYGVAALANEGAIVPLDDYLDLIPNIVAAVGEERFADWKAADGHFYTIPTIVNVPGSQSTAVRKDWLDKLNMDVPTTWEQWKAYWYGVRDNDMNGNGDTTDEIPIVLEMGQNGERSLHALLNAFGIKASSDAQFCVLDDGTYTMVYEHPRYREFITEMQQLYADKIIDQEFATRYQADMYNTMSGNLAGTVFTWAEQCAVHSETLIANGVEDGLYLTCAPITGPYGDQWIQKRQGITGNWCITAKAEADGKVEDILKFWNWMFSDEGVMLYNYGIEGYTYTMVDGSPVINPEITAAGFNDYRTLGMEFEPVGGNWQNDAFMQCVFSGKTVDELTIPRKSFYDGLNEHGVNDGKYYAMPPTLETEAYVEYRAELITSGVCALRDQCVAGQLSVDDFFAKYEELKGRGLQDIIDQGTEAYALIVGE
ncbi:MAG: extracellular solute-binding protein [Candidatus Limiplasma sp.]|nr:extracellular solute-binding protein [Candidatus Limiplasma sp.]